MLRTIVLPRTALAAVQNGAAVLRFCYIEDTRAFIASVIIYLLRTRILYQAILFHCNESPLR